MRNNSLISKCLALCFGLIFASTALATENDPVLKIGSPAPALKGTWIKGNASPNFEKGKIYVVEMWATWCGFCIQAMPHLSELARKYKDQNVVFVGVDMMERGKRETIDKNVEDFVTKKGSDMDYNVCMDGDDQSIALAYIAQYHFAGIPQTYIIDQDGNLAWEGNPLPGWSTFKLAPGQLSVEMVINQLQTKTFDYKKSAAEFDKEVAENESSVSYQAFMEQRASFLIKKKDYQGCLDFSNAFLAKHPSARNRFTGYFLECYLGLNRDADALATAQDVKEHYSANGGMAWMARIVMSWKGTVPKDLYLMAGDYFKSLPDNPENRQKAADAYGKAGKTPF